MADKIVTPRRQRLGQVLRSLREATGKTGTQTAEELGWSAAKVSRIETALTLPSEDDIAVLIDHYGNDTVTLQKVLKLRHDATQKGWWEKYGESLTPGYAAYISLEAEATEMRNWEPMIFPGLLQTPAYARYLVGRTIHPVVKIPPAFVRDRVEVRMRRQQTLLYGDKPIQLQVVFDESVLRRDIGDPEVMLEQLRYVIELTELPNVELRISPLGTPSPAPWGSFVHLRFADLPDVVYLEDPEGGRFGSNPEHVFGYENAFDELMEVALDRQASVRLIQESMAQWQA
ncbi:helix-turn-helix domain-containing protein [Herbidospora daliensis]|uniref:helix-turn-helix domain-containing protein n=1 Tax=Herbidospora daliensis TaxID=295585 RepID=UPI0007C7F958|nr:helix-turn-helix transcriptional regulator [Herbidospora daliensis]